MERHFIGYTIYQYFIYIHTSLYGPLFIWNFAITALNLGTFSIYGLKCFTITTNRTFFNAFLSAEFRID